MLVVFERLRTKAVSTYEANKIIRESVQLIMPRVSLFLPMLSHKIREGAGGSTI
jgi:hypothetical protein